jgi:hypothetical protein
VLDLLEPFQQGFFGDTELHGEMAENALDGQDALRNLRPLASQSIGNAKEGRPERATFRNSKKFPALR